MAQNVLQLSNEGVDTLTRMYNFLVNHRGMSPQAASAILGNVMQESTFNHAAVSSKNAKGVYQLLGDKYKNYLNYISGKGWQDGPLSQTSFVIDELKNGKDTYYETYDELKRREANNWSTPTADGTGWYRNVNDSIYFANVYKDREANGTLPPRREDAWRVISTSTDIPEITTMFMNYWERPGEQEAKLDTRIGYANEIYNYFNKKQFGGKLNYLNYFN
jgi:hypothetical protein